LDKYLLLIPGFLIGITIHEFFHGYIAFRLGDSTAQRSGRLTLNPFFHIDLLGTVIVPAFLILSNSPILFGWAKPVPVDPRRFRDPRRGMMWSALAGPIANFCTAVVIGLFLNAFIRLAPSDTNVYSTLTSNLFVMLFYAFQINVVLGAFNLIPLHPLDGSKVLAGMIPQKHEVEFDRFQRFGPMILMGFIVLGSMLRFSVIRLFISPFLHVFNHIFLNQPGF
jgi:Zn-dependent protease